MKDLALTIGGTTVNAPAGVPNPNTVEASTIVRFTISLLFLFAILACLFSLVYAGVKWIISEGKKEAVESAHNQILFSVIGLALVFLSFLIINFIGDLFKVNLLNIPF